YGYDQAGRLSTFSGTLGDGTSRTYASVTQYNAASQKERESFGTGTNGMTTPLYLKLHYNKRLQMVDQRLGSVNDEWNWNRGALIFYYGTNAVSYWNPFQDDTDNNGNVRRQVSYVPTAVDGSGNVTTSVIPELQDYTYDALNRIGSVAEQQQNSGGSWAASCSQTFGYDRFGNRQITAVTGGVNSYNPSYTTSTNRISGLTYDSAGNITYDVASGGTMTYDAENHLVTASSGGTYVYDGEGKRVKRTASSQEWWYVYGTGGELVAEYLSTGTTTVKKEYGYRGGQLLVVWDVDKTGDERLKWLVPDHLGSTRMEADKSGSLSAMVRHDYLPFGEELTAGIRGSGYGYVSTNVRQKFASKEWDNETGLNFFGARYFASSQGRFTSIDPMLASGSIYNPQTWNRYSYALNSPLNLIDPTGMYTYAAGTSDEQKKQFEESLKNMKEARDKYKKDKNSDEYKSLDRALKAYGDPNKDNGVTVRFGSADTPGNTKVEVKADQGGKLTGPDITVTIDPSQNTTAAALFQTVTHEGSHTADGLELIRSLPKDLTDTNALTTALNAPLNLTSYETETRAYTTQIYGMSALASKFSVSSINQTWVRIEVWNSGWRGADAVTKRANGISAVLALPKALCGTYEVTSQEQGRKLIQ
ncbi:MAG: RHS repeat-associated core domain-containing protein, partial [Acidobacteriota bacterium]